MQLNSVTLLATVCTASVEIQNAANDTVKDNGLLTLINGAGPSPLVGTPPSQNTIAEAKPGIINGIQQIFQQSVNHSTSFLHQGNNLRGVESQLPVNVKIDDFPTLSPTAAGGIGGLIKDFANKVHLNLTPPLKTLNENSKGNETTNSIHSVDEKHLVGTEVPNVHGTDEKRISGGAFGGLAIGEMHASAGAPAGFAIDEKRLVSTGAAGGFVIDEKHLGTESLSLYALDEKLTTVLNLGGSIVDQKRVNTGVSNEFLMDPKAVKLGGAAGVYQFNDKNIDQVGSGLRGSQEINLDGDINKVNAGEEPNSNRRKGPAGGSSTGWMAAAGGVGILGTSSIALWIRRRMNRASQDNLNRFGSPQYGLNEVPRRFRA